MLNKQAVMKMTRVLYQRLMIQLKHQQYIIYMLKKLAVSCQKISVMSLKYTLYSVYLLKKQAETQSEGLNMQSFSSTQLKIVQQTLQL